MPRRRDCLVPELLVLALPSACQRNASERERTSSTTAAPTDDADPPLGPGKPLTPLTPTAIGAAIPTEPPPERFWEQDPPCPPGTALQGKLPPSAEAIRCVTPEGRWDGPEARFHPEPEGQVQSLGRHVDGRRSGLWWYFHPNGAKAAEHPYVDGELHGTLRRWAESGVEIELAEYRAGRPWGLFITRDEAGQELARAQLDAGTGTLVRVDAGRRTESDYVGGQLHGVHREYDDQGRKRRESHWSGGDTHGRETAWDESGAKTSEHNVVAGQQHGIDTRWRAGQITERSVWVAGEQRSRQLYRDGEPLAALPEPSACDEDPGLSRVLEASRGHGLSDEAACVTRNPLFPGLVIVGDFAHDAGCIDSTWVVDCIVSEAALEPAAVLARAGWAEADGEQRIMIAQEYLRSFGLAGSYVSSQIEAPLWRVRDDGGVEAILWVSEPAGMVPRQTLDKLEFRFDVAGELSRAMLEHRSDPI